MAAWPRVPGQNIMTSEAIVKECLLLGSEEIERASVQEEAGQVQPSSHLLPLTPPRLLLPFTYVPITPPSHCEPIRY